ncbi:DUF6069 family protein [Halocatena halophila]|uniref:DUF6069 family protein n=1 Tax=Halocatena halophila TaxID=2814576 RepID=UPI002ED3C8AB
MPTTAPVVESERSKHVRRTQLIRSSGLAVFAAIVVNILVLELALAVVAIPSAFEPVPLGWGPVAASSAVGAVGATVAYGVIARYAEHPNRMFTIVGVIVWVLSYANLLTPALNGAPVVVYAILGLMHVTSALTIIWLLRQPPTRPDDTVEDPQ